MIVAPRFARLHHPAKSDRMALRHIGAFDDDDIRVHQIRRKVSRAASAKRGPQTGDRGGVSNTGLIFYLNNAEAGEQLLDQIVLFVVERGAAQVRDAHRAPERRRRLCSCLPRCASRVFFTRSATMSIACSSGIFSHSVPYGWR